MILLAFLGVYANAQTLEWTWMGGSSTASCGAHPYCGQPGVYGTLGTSAPENQPGSRANAVSWTDSSGDLWLFGGSGFDAKDNIGDLNDLWEFDPSTDEWTWWGGSSAIVGDSGNAGVYGTLGTAAATNIPGRRYGAKGWIGSDSHLWLFGGYGFDAKGKCGFLNDLWEFDPSANEWTWMGGSSTIPKQGEGQAGSYGSLGIAGIENIPGGRDDAVVWTDSGGDFWLSGGSGYDENGNWGDLNDLWRFNANTLEWTWVSGSSSAGSYCSPVYSQTFCGQPGVYGTLGTAAAANTPSGRAGAVNWIDSSNHLWLFGGTGYDSFFNDLWTFDPFTGEWTWMGGSDSVNAFGTYGVLGIADAANIPGGRYEAATWVDNSDNFWLLGGLGYDASGETGKLNDFWKFDPSTNEWAWMGGSDAVSCTGCGPSGVYGTLRTSSASNFPGGRSGVVTWTDSYGNLWLFGGFGFDAAGHSSALNDLWKFQTTTSAVPATATPTFSIVAGAYSSSLSVTISDRTAGATIYYTTDGTTPTASSTEYTGAITISSSETLEAIATASGYSTSAVAIAVYTFADPATAAPTFSPVAGTYNSTQVVTLSVSTAGATIYYTTDGTEPTTSSAIYAGAIPITSTKTLQSIAVASGYSTSAVATALYIIERTAATPSFSPVAGNYDTAQSVTIADSTLGAVLYYTTDGTTPTSSSTVYSGAIPVSATETIEAIATATGYASSAVATATYSIDPAAISVPTFTVSGTAVTVTRGATTGNVSTITVAPSGGFTGNVALTAAITSSPAGATLSPTLSFESTNSVNIPGTAAGTATLTISSSAASAALAYPASPVGWRPLAALACLMLCFPPTRNRWRTVFGMIVLFAWLANGVLACGGATFKKVGNGPGTSSRSATTTGTYIITVTGTSGSITEAGTFTLTLL